LRVLTFELRGKLGHYRRPDTTVTHSSYPFVPRTTLLGLLASVLGRESLEGDSWVGLRLLSPIRLSSQQMSMLGKGWLGGGTESFNRPVSVELVVDPHYRVYYAGGHLDELASWLEQGRSYYHTYLGSAFCLTFPEFLGVVSAREVQPSSKRELKVQTIVPTHAVSRIMPRPGRQYARAGGLRYEHIGDREFRGTVNLLYEVNGGPVEIRARDGSVEPPVRFVALETGEVVCLW